MTVNINDGIIAHDGFTAIGPLEDDFDSMSYVLFDSPTLAFGIGSNGMGQTLDTTRAEGLFARFLDIWKQRKVEADIRIADETAAREKFLAEEEARRAIAIQKAQEPFYIPVTKDAVIGRMTDEELEGLEDILDSNRVVRVLWTHSNGLTDIKSRLIDLFVLEGWRRERADELFADVLVVPPKMDAPTE